MASSDFVAVEVTAYDRLIFSWEAVADAGANASRIDWVLSLEAGEYGAILATPGSGWRVVLDAATYSGTTDIAIGNNETKVLASGSAVLAHNADGTRSFRFSFTQEFRIYFGDQYIPDISGDGTAVLDTIPRATVPTLSAGSAELGSVVTVRAEGGEGFVHKLEYRFGDAAGIIGENVAGEIQWTPPEELGLQIPNAPQGTARILCTTYLEGQQLGSVQEAALVLTVPESAVPQVTELELTDPSGAWDRFGGPVQSISSLILDAVVESALGSAVTDMAVALDGKAYSGGVLSEAGDHTLTIRVMDTRGRTGSLERTVTVLAYEKPRLSLSAHRCTETREADDTGAFALVAVAGSVTALEGNEAALSLEYGGEAEVSSREAAFSLELLKEAPTESCIPIRAVLTDQLSQTEAEMTLSAAYATMDLLSGGRGIAFGTTASSPGFQCAMDARFTGAVQVAVLEAGDVRLADGTALSQLGDVAAVLDAINGEVV